MQVAILNTAVTVDLSKEVTLSKDLKEVRELVMISMGRAFQAERMTSEKVLGWKFIWHIRRITRPVGLEWG